ncbi:hypothetical protein BHE74_00007181 [Ensete ventricosum]|nr:hypothetical protein BHE74_00007181 [Ensete ventricosum]RZR86205.1 hypothetical protein BHM03_00013351 [Ensete ventricosum]
MATLESRDLPFHFHWRMRERVARLPSLTWVVLSETITPPAYGSRKRQAGFHRWGVGRVLMELNSNVCVRS